MVGGFFAAVGMQAVGQADADMNMVMLYFRSSQWAEKLDTSQLH